MTKRYIFYDKHAKTKRRLFILSLVMTFVSVGAGLGILKLSNMKTINQGLDTIYEDRVLPLQQLKQISDMYGIHIVDTAHKVLNGNTSWSAGRKNVVETTRKIPQMWAEYLKTHLVDEEKRVIEELNSLFADADTSSKQLTTILHNEDRKALAEFVQKELYRNIDPVTNKLGALFQMQIRVAKEVRDSEKLRYKFSLTLGTASIVLSIILCTIIVLQRKRWRTLMDSL
ncbi:MCP four helix bundle domain-containing protein [Patescibacteria group bacterium]|nr:MCP four helix bundle domain-containing protein [Patescibacteria group bacterium]